MTGRSDLWLPDPEAMCGIFGVICASDKLADGIRKFAADHRTLEALVAQRIG